ncbi:MAG: alkanesulfonate monooxygenase SsuD [Alphaproteobacteria bacterium]|jgi:alkanesulfonate monooxygenase SsuD/methylene tetrahydromethanopterin reductase-like flavin-dependent oxidoreductase (luciferase family)
MKIGVSLFPENLGYEGAVEVAMRAEAKGIDEVFTVELGFQNDAVATAMAIAARTERITVGTGIANIYWRHPYSLACAAIAINQVSKGRFILGIGVGHPHLVKAQNIPWRPPVTALRETTEQVRQVFNNAPPEQAAGRAFVDAGDLIPVHWAGVGDQTVRGAGKHADGLMLYLCSGDRFSSIQNAVQNEFEKTHRNLEAFDLSLLIPTFMDQDLESARAAARNFLVPYSAMPVHAKMFRASGFDAEMNAIEARLSNADRDGGMKAISDDMLDAVCLIGDASRIAKGLNKLKERGVRHALIAPRAIDPNNARRDILRTVDAFGEITASK